MSQTFASHATQGTTGSRGKTTRRRCTKSVRGDEGAWIATAKQELLAMPPWTAFQVIATATYGGEARSWVMYTRRNRADAEALADARNGVTFEIREVQMRWVWNGRDVVEQVV